MKRISIVLMSIICFLVADVAYARTLTLEQVLQKVMDHYPSLKSAAIQVERARQNSKKVESQLGWQLGAQAGVTRDVSLFGTPSDNINLSGTLSRKLASGASVGIEAGAQRIDSESVFSPLIPNPSTSTSIDLSFRQPLSKGMDNPLYEEGLISAHAEVVISQADRFRLYDQLATQIIDLYMAAATTRARIQNIERAVKRTLRLQNYIKSRKRLGVSEEKDSLQVTAQLNSQRAEFRGLQMLWQQQRISLNRLMGRKWSSGLEPTIMEPGSTPDEDFETLFNKVKQHNPDLLRVDARIKLADSVIRTRRDEREDIVDLVLTLGNRTRSGDTFGGDVSESEIVGGVSLEFNRGFDKQGDDAELYRAQLERSAALQDKRQIIEDLKYDLSSLLAELEAGYVALKAYKRSVDSELKKLNEAEDRHRRGRTDTDQLIQFESQLSAAELSQELQRIELARRYRNLSLLQGFLWRNIRLPEYDTFITDDYGDQQ